MSTYKQVQRMSWMSCVNVYRPIVDSTLRNVNHHKSIHPIMYSPFHLKQDVMPASDRINAVALVK